MFPKEILSQTTESLFQHHVGRSNIIYISIIVSFCMGVFSLPFISVSVNTQSQALIRPASEISSVRSLVSGQVKEIFISENTSVKKGDILYTIESDVIDEKEKYLQNRIKEITEFKNDLNSLMLFISSSNIFKPIHLETSLYRQAIDNYREKWNDYSTKYEKVSRDYARNIRLHTEKVIADAEFENYAFELDKVKNELEIVRQTQLSQWQSELRNYERESTEFKSQLIQLLKERSNLTITAPISGAIQNLTGLYPGSMVFTNQDLAQISPDTSLIVEAYINPSDIGLIKVSMPVRFQVTAFNYNQWGLATGKVFDISSDIQIINDHPIFKVRCTLDKDYLQLKNGYQGYLKKGMTLQARFMVTERTLWQLLYDKLEDWLNPNAFTK